ncbi:MAG: 1-acyl-sn-glycerol-3-phosphate acyltransferase [Chloroflexi bacterium]|nr:1-acyl-sn-glycerol-3-phosphate acyltransferase [Chloroflexota bacterium]
MSITLYDACRPPVALALKLICRYRFVNREVSLPDGPLIVASNHLSWLDIPLIGVGIRRRRISFMAKKEYFHSPVHAFIIRALGSFTVDRTTVDRSAFDLADKALRDGRALGIFPEGTRSRTLQLQKGKLGVAFIALRSNAVILPIGISGTEKIRHRYQGSNRRLLYRPGVTVNIGQPFRLPQVSGKPSRADLATSTETIMKHIAELLPEDYRGLYRSDGH